MKCERKKKTRKLSKQERKKNSEEKRKRKKNSEKKNLVKERRILKKKDIEEIYRSYRRTRYNVDGHEIRPVEFL
jgi:hypothetical protein